jgi:hypothetical protein
MHKKSVLMFFSSVGALTLGFTSVLPAAVAETGAWRAYGNTNPITSSRSNWHCGKTIQVGYKVVSQVCIVTTPDGRSIQGAVIVRNNNSYLYNVNAQVTVYANRNGSWNCPRSNVAKNSWSVCFGSTFRWDTGFRSFADGVVNGVSLPRSRSITSI